MLEKFDKYRRHFIISSILFAVFGYIVACIFIGFLIAASGEALYPKLANISAPFLCGQKEYQIEKRDHFVPPSTRGYTLHFSCPAKDGSNPRPVDVMKLLIVNTTLYTGIGLLLLPVWGLLIWMIYRIVQSRMRQNSPT